MPVRRRTLGLPLCSMLTPSSSWSAIRLASPVSFTSYRSCLFTAHLALWGPLGADRGQGYWYELSRPGPSNPAPLQALPLGVIRSSFAVPGGQGGSNGAGWILHRTHDGGNFLTPCVSYVSALPVGCLCYFIPSCTLGWLLDAVDLSRPLHGRVPPPRFPSHLDVLLRGGKSQAPPCPQTNSQEPSASPQPQMLYMGCQVASHRTQLPQSPLDLVCWALMHQAG